jgi:hypothetical protein
MKRFVTIVLLVVMVAGLTGCYPFNKQTVTGKVTDLTQSGGEDSIKLVEVDNRNWYKVEDELFLGQFRSRDMWGALEEGKTYTFTTYGYRMGFLSEYPNITAVQEAAQ